MFPYILRVKSWKMSSADHPNTYKAYAFTEKGGQLQEVQVEWKDPQPGEIIVKVLACGVCAGDEIVKGQEMPTGLPRVPGHEIVGNVVAVAPGELVWKAGQRVGAGWHGGHCGVCNQCRSGDFICCEKEDINGIFRDGGYAEYVTLRSEVCARIPEDIDPAEAAPLLCAGVTTFNSLRNMTAQPPDYVAVQGIGGLGHLAIQFARAMGFRVVALSSSSAKESLSLKLGAHLYLDGSKVDQAGELQKLGGARVIMCTAPNAKVIQSLVPALAVNGELLLLAVCDEIAINPVPLVNKRLSIRGWPAGSAKDDEECIIFAQAHGIKCMVERFPLEKAQEAYEHRGSAKFRAVIVP
ncbi:GroES-like protein [Obba rivulosa]|uniref:GroES-like protein n=1 Tax=Obba rivulosa TaxID=1052685 RepID=A0A8E2DU28_9APHY|nr:GroES-like protein [Obba rivulosa]